MNVSEPIEAFSVRKYGNLSYKISIVKDISTGDRPLGYPRQLPCARNLEDASLIASLD